MYCKSFNDFPEQSCTPSQSAFIPGRLITNDAFITFEISHFLKKCRIMHGTFTLKLDVSKTYD